jgi:DNA repair ATPase RecN
MLQSLDIRNLTVFAEANLRFSPHLNVIAGENGSGKSHLLKVAHAILAASAEEGRKPTASAPTKTLLQTRVAENLIAVLRPESLGRLARRKQGRERCRLRLGFDR